MLGLSTQRRHWSWLILYLLAGAAAGATGYALGITAHVILFQSDHPFAVAEWSVRAAFRLTDNPFIALWIYVVLLFLAPAIVWGSAAAVSGSLFGLAVGHILHCSRRQSGLWLVLWLGSTTIFWTSSTFLTRNTSLWSDTFHPRWSLFGALLSCIAATIAFSRKARVTQSPEISQG